MILKLARVMKTADTSCGLSSSHSPNCSALSMTVIALVLYFPYTAQPKATLIPKYRQ